MSEPDQPELPDLSRADEARIRALLAEARHGEPMPEAVRTRLDRVLAGLADEGAPVAADVVPLADRRRRAAKMLVAAAAIVVAGVGIGQVVGNGQGSGDAVSGAAAPNDAKAGGPEGGSAGTGAGADRPDAMTDAPQSMSGGALAAGESAYQVRPRHFAADSRRVRAHYDSVNTAAGERAPTCSPGDWGAGTYVPVRYGRAPGYLVLRRPSGESQVADLFLCAGDSPVRSITLPGP
jgi:hypothetical protein